MTDRFESDELDDGRFVASRIAYIKPTGSEEAHRNSFHISFAHEILREVEELVPSKATQSVIRSSDLFKTPSNADQ